MEVPVNAALALSGILLMLGLIGVLVRRNIIFMLMSIEVMLNAAGLAFVVGSAKHGAVDGQVMFLFILAVAAAEVAVGLALIIKVYQHFQTLDTDGLNHLKG